jgi:hypothetical protein
MLLLSRNRQQPSAARGPQSPGLIQLAPVKHLVRIDAMGPRYARPPMRLRPASPRQSSASPRCCGAAVLMPPTSLCLSEQLRPAGKCPSPLHVDTYPKYPLRREWLTFMRMSRRSQTYAYGPPGKPENAPMQTALSISTRNIRRRQRPTRRPYRNAVAPAENSERYVQGKRSLPG